MQVGLRDVKFENGPVSRHRGIGDDFSRISSGNSSGLLPGLLSGLANDERIATRDPVLDIKLLRRRQRVKICRAHRQGRGTANFLDCIAHLLR